MRLACVRRCEMVRVLYFCVANYASDNRKGVDVAALAYADFCRS